MHEMGLKPPSGGDTYFPKFRTIRRSTGDELDPTTTFTLLPNKDPHALVALRAYADSIDFDRTGLGKALAEVFPIDAGL
jgi:hypothetical protein